MISRKDLYTRTDELWNEIEDNLDELGVSNFYVPETIMEEYALEAFIEAMNRLTPAEVIKRLQKVKKKKK